MTNKSKSIYKTVRLTPELDEWIKACAKEEVRSESAVIFNILKKEMNRQPIFTYECTEFTKEQLELLMNSPNTDCVQK